MFSRLRKLFIRKSPAEWPFDQPRNCTTFTTREVLEQGEPILLVTHDADDHAWQFIGSTDGTAENVKLVCLGCMVDHDPSVVEVADLPLGWEAVRDGPTSPWVRRIHPPHDDE